MCLVLPRDAPTQDIALFLPTMVGSPEGSAGGPVFLAFHVNCPNRYLSEESINNAREALGSSPAYILGRIILVEQHVASEVGGLACLASFVRLLPSSLWVD